jgi:hypothetical protein
MAAAAKKRSVKMICGGSFNKKEDSGREFFYSLREDVDDNHKPVTVVCAVDINGYLINDGNLIVLPHGKDDEVLFCDHINENLDLNLDDARILMHDESCIDDNDYIG